MPHPIGYYVSARPEHPAALTLATLERRYGSYFEALSPQDLQAVLAYCTQWCLPGDPCFILNLAGCSVNADTAIDIIMELEHCEGAASWYLAMIPFLHQQIQSRYQEVGRDAN